MPSSQVLKYWVINNSIIMVLRKNNRKTIGLQKRIVKGILIIGALSLLTIFILGNHGLHQLYKLKKQRTEIQNKIDLLREEKIALENQKNKLTTDYKHIEELAREKYRMAKKGEKVFKVIEKKEN